MREERAERQRLRKPPQLSREKIKQIADRAERKAAPLAEPPPKKRKGRRRV